MNISCDRIVVLAATTLFSSSVFAVGVDGVPHCLIREGDPYPGGGADEFVFTISDIWINQVGGYGATLNNKNGAGTELNFDIIWGQVKSSDGPPHRIIAEGGFDAPYTNYAIRQGGKVDNHGNAWYAGWANGAGAGPDSIWKNSDLIWIEDDPIPSLPEQYFSFLTHLGVADDGSAIYFIGGIANSPNGITVNRGFFDINGNVLWKGGDILPGYANPVSLEFLPPSDFQFDVSANGTNYVSKVRLAGSPVTDAMVFNGAAFVSRGTAMREGNLIPASTPGVIGSEHWDNFFFAATNEAGNVLVAGDTDGDPASDQFVYSNHEFVLREGDTIGHHFNANQYTIWNGSVRGADLNDHGDWLVRWGVTDPLHGAYILNGLVLIEEGDNVDFDNDGIIDSYATITSFGGSFNEMKLTDRDIEGRVTAYLQAEVDIYGTSTTTDDFQVMLSVDVQVPAPGALALFGLAGVCGRRRRRA